MTSYQERLYEVAKECLWLSEAYPDDREHWLDSAAHFMVEYYHGE